MKKTKNIIYWIVALIPYLVTLAFMPFLKERIPMHYDLSGNVDRWGSKYEMFVVPIAFLPAIILFFVLYIYYAKKGKGDEKEAAHANSNGKVIYFVGIAMSVFESIIIACSMISAKQVVDLGITHEKFDTIKIVLIAFGVLFILLGNIMPKTRTNLLVGLRTPFSMHNEAIWRDSNRFGGILLVIGGVMNIIFGIVFSGMIATSLLIASVVGIAVISTIYSYMSYRKYR